MLAKRTKHRNHQTNNLIKYYGLNNKIMIFYLPWISFADACIRIILGRFVRVFTGLIRVITQRFVSPSIPSKPRFHSLINFDRNLNFLIVVLFLNQSYFFKGGLMSESFSIWLQSTKKSAKSLSYGLSSFHGRNTILAGFFSTKINILKGKD